MPALNLTVSFTCSNADLPGMGAGVSFLLPPENDMARAAVPNKVPKARYSFLIARPRMTLKSCEPYCPRRKEKIATY